MDIIEIVAGCQGWEIFLLGKIGEAFILIECPVEPAQLD